MDQLLSYYRSGANWKSDNLKVINYFLNRSKECFAVTQNPSENVALFKNKLPVGDINMALVVEKMKKLKTDIGETSEAFMETKVIKLKPTTTKTQTPNPHHLPLHLILTITPNPYT